MLAVSRQPISLSARHQLPSASHNMGYVTSALAAAAHVLTTQRKTMAESWAVLTLPLWVAGQKSCTSTVGHPLTCETSEHLPSLLQGLPPKPPSHTMPIPILSWAPQVLPWKKGTLWHHSFPMYEEKHCGFVSMKPEAHFKSWKLLQNQQPSLWLNFQRRCVNSQKVVEMLSVIKKGQPCGEQVEMPLVGWVCPGGTDPPCCLHQLCSSANVLGRGAGIFSLNKLNLYVSPSASYCFTATILRSFL